VPDELEEGRTIHCGLLHVPQARSDPDGMQVSLPYAQIRAESAHPQPDPIVYIGGGPGGSSLAEFDTLYAWLRPLRRDRDLILYDQRGTLLASPVLDCAVADPATPTPAEFAAAEAGVPAALLPLNANDVAVAACAARLQAAGIDLAQYDTATHAADLVDLAAALGYPHYALYATSYGTRIVLEVMRSEAAGPVAAVLDATLPPQAMPYERETTAAAELLDQVFAQCAADPVCAIAYPDLAATFVRLAQLPDVTLPALSPVWNAEPTGHTLWRFVLERLSPETASYAPAIVTELGRGEVATLTAVWRGELPPPVPPVTGASDPDVDPIRVNEFVLHLNAAYFLNRDRLGAAAQVEWRRLAGRNADRARLARFIADYLPAEAADGVSPLRTAVTPPAGDLLAQLAALNDAELSVAFAELAGAPPFPMTTGANLAAECRDELPFNNYAVAVTAHQGRGIPNDVVERELRQLRHFWAQCALFPTGGAAITQTLPVTSSMPVLILQGGLDAVTPPAWAEAARQSLSGAHYVLFPAAGHVVSSQAESLRTGCVTRLVAAFLDAPRAAPDTTCVAAHYGIAWRLPE
jgi:pimeloyl-ACP methyl ester carboxylesterase